MTRCPCVAPGGLDITGGTYAGQIKIVEWSIHEPGKHRGNPSQAIRLDDHGRGPTWYPTASSRRRSKKNGRTVLDAEHCKQLDSPPRRPGHRFSGCKTGSDPTAKAYLDTRKAERTDAVSPAPAAASAAKRERLPAIYEASRYFQVAASLICLVGRSR